MLLTVPAEGHENSFSYVMSEWTQLQGRLFYADTGCFFLFDNQVIYEELLVHGCHLKIFRKYSC